VHFHDDRPDLVHDEPAVRHEALYWQAAEVARRIASGERESPLRPLAASVRCLELLDDVRTVAGIPPAGPRAE
jgi:hypothetical protein